MVASKVGLPMGDKPNQRGLSRKHILEAVEASLDRLDMDYMDLLIIHRLDHDTPMEESAQPLMMWCVLGVRIILGRLPCLRGSS